MGFLLSGGGGTFRVNSNLGKYGYLGQCDFPNTDIFFRANYYYKKIFSEHPFCEGRCESAVRRCARGTPGGREDAGGGGGGCGQGFQQVLIFRFFMENLLRC